MSQSRASEPRTSALRSDSDEQIARVRLLDDYPFACTAEGGCGAFVRSVPSAEQSYQGGVLSNFFQRYGVQPGDVFNVRIGE
ncbi:NucA/NucB deoxyribonuclease domain-containing protein [Microbacterium sp.]|uniref:NucA/NucB deoxyribonuclease domain-containing protein n=1 Tax=Microbacterium sp. TaxID=51671 RepID=UPI00343123F8